MNDDKDLSEHSKNNYFYTCSDAELVENCNPVVFVLELEDEASCQEASILLSSFLDKRKTVRVVWYTIILKLAQVTSLLMHCYEKCLFMDIEINIHPIFTYIIFVLIQFIHY